MDMSVTEVQSPLNIVDCLRGDRSLRPRADFLSAAGIRAQLEDGIYELLGARVIAEPLVLRSSTLADEQFSTNINSSPMGQLRGILVSHVLRLLSIGFEVTDPYAEALSAWKAEDTGSQLFSHLARLEPDERARLQSDVNAHSVALRRALGVVPPRWLPRTAVRQSQRLAGGNVILRDVIDLMVGTTTSAEASVALFDVTTSPLSEAAERTMRFHALVQTLRTSCVPLRTCTFSTATGELWTRDVDYEMLSRSADEVLHALGTLVAQL